MSPKQDESLVGKLTNVTDDKKGTIFGFVLKQEPSGDKYAVFVYGTEKDDSGFNSAGTESSQCHFSKEKLVVLADQKCEHFRTIAQRMIEKLCAKKAFDKARPWLEAYNARWPEDWAISCKYADLLRSTYNDDKKAYGIAKEAVEFIPASEKEALMKNYYDLSIGCMVASGDVEEAFEWSNKLDKSDPEGRKLFLETLTVIANISHEASQGHHPDKLNRSVLENCCKVSLAYIELQPDDSKHLIFAANWSGLLGRKQDAVRLYRRALATPLDADLKDRINKDLAVAMMQCPGGAMEDYILLTIENGNFIAIHKKDSGKYKLVPTASVDLDGSTKYAVVTLEKLSVTLFPILDPADLAAFGAADIPPE